jgi:hypothetical protein
MSIQSVVVSYDEAHKHLISYLFCDSRFRNEIAYEYIWGGHYATSRKFAGSIPDEVIGFFQFH